jgi:hypothetical protein
VVAPLVFGDELPREINIVRDRAAVAVSIRFESYAAAGIAPLSKGERVMLDRERLGTFYRELQTPSRIEANTPTPQVEEAEEDFKSELTQS